MQTSSVSKLRFDNSPMKLEAKTGRERLLAIKHPSRRLGDIRSIFSNYFFLSFVIIVGNYGSITRLFDCSVVPFSCLCTFYA
jgi:hypothetical protein